MSTIDPIAAYEMAIRAKKNLLHHNPVPDCKVTKEMETKLAKQATSARDTFQTANQEWTAWDMLRRNHELNAGKADYTLALIDLLSSDTVDLWA